ncbi:hypothetical protein JOF58_000901 [Streptomyces cinnamonensis]|nr:hypothetical protein [Streptomyces virginiae]
MTLPSAPAASRPRGSRLPPVPARPLDRGPRHAGRDSRLRPRLRSPPTGSRPPRARRRSWARRVSQTGLGRFHIAVGRPFAQQISSGRGSVHCAEVRGKAPRLMGRPQQSQSSLVRAPASSRVRAASTAASNQAAASISTGASASRSLLFHMLRPVTVRIARTASICRSPASASSTRNPGSSTHPPRPSTSCPASEPSRQLPSAVGGWTMGPAGYRRTRIRMAARWRAAWQVMASLSVRMARPRHC